MRCAKPFAAFCAASVLLGASWGVRGFSQKRPKGPPLEELSALAQRAAEGKLDDADRKQIPPLQLALQRQKEAALASLARGLQAGLDCNRLLTHSALADALECPEVAQFADARLPITLTSILKRVTPKSALTAVPEWTQVCPDCGGTRQADCPSCSGQGTRACPKCNGRGLVTGPFKHVDTCPQCQGSSELRCPKCGGTGLIACPCAEKSQTDRTIAAYRIFTPAEAEAARKVISLAEQVLQGGTDLCLASALRPSPLAPRAAQTQPTTRPAP